MNILRFARRFMQMNKTAEDIPHVSNAAHPDYPALQRAYYDPSKAEATTKAFPMPPSRNLTRNEPVWKHVPDPAYGWRKTRDEILSPIAGKVPGQWLRDPTVKSKLSSPTGENPISASDEIVRNISRRVRNARANRAAIHIPGPDRPNNMYMYDRHPEEILTQRMQRIYDSDMPVSPVDVADDTAGFPYERAGTVFSDKMDAAERYNQRLDENIRIQDEARAQADQREFWNRTKADWLERNKTLNDPATRPYQDEFDIYHATRSRTDPQEEQLLKQQAILQNRNPPVTIEQLREAMRPKTGR